MSSHSDTFAASGNSPTALESLVTIILSGQNARLIEIKAGQIFFSPDIVPAPIQSIPINEFNSRSVRAALRQLQIEAVQSEIATDAEPVDSSGIAAKGKQPETSTATAPLATGKGVEAVRARITSAFQRAREHGAVKYQPELVSLDDEINALVRPAKPRQRPTPKPLAPKAVPLLSLEKLVEPLLTELSDSVADIEQPKSFGKNVHHDLGEIQVDGDAEFQRKVRLLCAAAMLSKESKRKP